MEIKSHKSFNFVEIHRVEYKNGCVWKTQPYGFTYHKGSRYGDKFIPSSISTSLMKHKTINLEPFYPDFILR